MGYVERDEAAEAALKGRAKGEGAEEEEKEKNLGEVAGNPPEGTARESRRS